MPLDTILPRNRVSLLAGVRDAGKTSFILPAMVAWPQCPPWVYVAADRSVLDAQQTIQNLNFKLTDVPLMSAYGKCRMDWGALMQALSERDPVPEIAVIEAFQDFAESINKRNLVHDFMNWVDAYCHPTRQFPRGITILGMTGSPKQSMRDRYPDPSQRIPGSSVWGERASAIFMVESAAKDLSLIGPDRILHVCRKHGSRLVLNGCFDTNNRLIFPNL